MSPLIVSNEGHHLSVTRSYVNRRMRWQCNSCFRFILRENAVWEVTSANDFEMPIEIEMRDIRCHLEFRPLAFLLQADNIQPNILRHFDPTKRADAVNRYSLFILPEENGNNQTLPFPHNISRLVLAGPDHHDWAVEACKWLRRFEGTYRLLDADEMDWKRSML